MTPSPSLRITIHDVPGEKLVLIAWGPDGAELFRHPLAAGVALDLAGDLIRGARVRLPSEAGP